MARISQMDDARAFSSFQSRSVSDPDRTPSGALEWLIDSSLLAGSLHNDPSDAFIRSSRLVRRPGASSRSRPVRNNSTDRSCLRVPPRSRSRCPKALRVPFRPRRRRTREAGASGAYDVRSGCVSFEPPFSPSLFFKNRRTARPTSCGISASGEISDRRAAASATDVGASEYLETLR
jgi:hypothetical protein